MTADVVAVEDLSLRLSGFALNHIDFSLRPGEILVILGPNGAGKSLTLETIAGFHRPDDGRVVINGRDVTRLAPERRHVGLLFQDFGLFPHLSVAENVGIGLRTKRSAPRRSLAETLAYLGIAHLARRNSLGLSPGEKQRVALARALATEPDLFLFDEPFSALDAPTRDRLRLDLEEFLRDTRVPAIFVTHDHGDALVLADRILVMRDGAIVQLGAAAAIFGRPANRFVAEFVGFENILPGRIVGQSGELLTVAVGGKMIEVAASDIVNDRGQDVWLCVRAENIDLYSIGHTPAGDRGLAGRILAVRNKGMLTRIVLDCGFSLHVCAMTRHVREMGLVPEALVEVTIAPHAIHAIPTSNRRDSGTSRNRCPG